MTNFISYWSAYADESEARCEQKAAWSEQSLAKGIVQRAVGGLASHLSSNQAVVSEIERAAEGLVVIRSHIEHKGYRFLVAGIEDRSPVSLASHAQELLDRSRETMCLCVVPDSAIPVWSSVVERCRSRAATFIPLFPVDVDVLAARRADLLDLIQYKLYRKLALNKPDGATQFDQRLFRAFIESRKCSAHAEDLDDILQALPDDPDHWVEHPLAGRVRDALDRGRGCLLVGPSSSGKSVLAFQVGRSYLLAGRRVRYLNMGLLGGHPHGLSEALDFGRPGSDQSSVLIVDDLQSNPFATRYFLSLASATRRAALLPPPDVLAVSWVDYSGEVAAFFEDCLPIAVRPHQVKQKIASCYRADLSEEDIHRLVQTFGDDVFLLRLSLDESKERKVRVGPRDLAEIVWRERTQGSGVQNEEVSRIGLVVGAIGRFDIPTPPGFLRHEAGTSDAAINALLHTGLLRQQGENISMGHRSLCGLLSDWLEWKGGWEALDKVGGPRNTGDVVLDYLRSLGSSLAVDSLRALHARAGFKDRPRLNRRAIALVGLWDAFTSVLERIEHQQTIDPTWGSVPSSAMFAVVAFAEIGKPEAGYKSIEFLRRHWTSRDGDIAVITEGLATSEDFIEIRKAMIEEDEVTGTLAHGPAAEVEFDRFHQTWVLGLILCAEASSQEPMVELQQLGELVEQQQLESGAFYPERVPWSTARVLLGLAACGRTVDTSPVVGTCVQWLLRDRANGGASSGGLWHSGTGRWNSTLETTGMVLLALAAAGHDCSDGRIDAARAYLLSQRSRWASPGNELDGALAIQAFLDTGGAWEEVAHEAQALSRWAKGEAFWKGAVRPAMESLEQSCRVAQIASHLISIGWTAIQSDLPAFLDALATPDLVRDEIQTATIGRPTETITARAVASIETPETPADDLEFQDLRSMESLHLAQYAVVGDYLRYDERIRNHLRDWRARIARPLGRPTQAHENFLIWAAPGSGKSFFIQEIARSLGNDVNYVEVNLARLSREAFCVKLGEVSNAEEPTLCLLDEIDVRSEEAWPYEECFSDLDLNLQPGRVAVFVLIGSTSAGMQSMVRGMLHRSKGMDLLDRVPVGNRFEIPGLSLQDRIIIVAREVVKTAAEREQTVQEIERLALYYVLKNEEIRTPRQLRDLAVSAICRMSSDDNRLKYDDLFERGDNRNQVFWVRHQHPAAELSNTFVRISDMKSLQDQERRPL